MRLTPTNSKLNNTVRSGLVQRRRACACPSVLRSSRAPRRGAWPPEAHKYRTMRKRCGRNGSRSSNMRASSARASPFNSQATAFGRCRSPVSTASANPAAVPSTYLAVQGPTPRSCCKASMADAGSRLPARSNRRPSWATTRRVCACWYGKPNETSRAAGSLANTDRRGGQRNLRRPGAGSPACRTSARHARVASCQLTSCSSTT